MKINVQSNTYTIIYASFLVIVFAFALSFASIKLKDRQNLNKEMEKKQMILKALGINCTREESINLYPKYIYDVVVLDYTGQRISGIDGFKIDLKNEYKKPEKDRLYPGFRAKVNGEEICVFPLYGKGLWGPIWGYIALKSDYNTIHNVVFDHEGETPGLGGDISMDYFQKRFVGKKIFDENNEFVGITITKPGVSKPEDLHRVDGISGATITSTGVHVMLHESLKPYLHCFIENRKK